MDDLQFAATVGAGWAIPLVCASFGAFAPLAPLPRVAISSAPVILVVAWVQLGIWEGRQILLDVEHFLPPPGYVGFYLGSMGLYSVGRKLHGWRFRGGCQSAHRDERPGYRSWIRTLSIWILVVALAVGAGVVRFHHPLRVLLLIPISLLLLFLGGALPHAASALAIRGRRDRAAAIAGVSLVGTVLFSKLLFVGALPSGPGFGSPNDDLFGPLTLGFAAGLLAVQALYLFAMAAIGRPFGYASDQGGPNPP